MLWAKAPMKWSQGNSRQLSSSHLHRFFSSHLYDTHFARHFAFIFGRPLNRAVCTRCRLSVCLSVVCLCCGNHMHVRRITVSYPGVDCSVWYSSVTVACMGPYSLFLRLYVGRWFSGRRRFGRPILVTAELFVLLYAVATIVLFLAWFFVYFSTNVQKRTEYQGHGSKVKVTVYRPPDTVDLGGLIFCWRFFLTAKTLAPLADCRESLPRDRKKVRLKNIVCLSQIFSLL